MLNRTFGTLFLLLTVLATTLGAQPIDKVVAANYPPLMIEGDAERPGYAVEVMLEAANRAGRQVDITFLPFERAMFALQNEGATLMPALFYGKKRNDLFQWLVEIQSAKLRFATVSGRVDDLETARALPTIAVESGTTADTFLTQLGFENLTRASTPESSAQMLAAGRVDAWFQNERAMQQMWQRLEIAEPLERGEIIHEVPIFLVASRALPADIATAYQDAVQSMQADGTLEAIWLQYNSKSN